MPVTFILLHQLVKLVARYEVDDLSKDILADVHNLAVLAAKLLNQFQIKKTKNVCKRLNIKYMDSDYDNETFRQLTKELKDEPEGGKRCTVCFSLRLKETAKRAKENSFDYFTTTLTVSPHKNSELINKLGIEIGERVGVKFLVADFKKREGYKRSIELSKEFDLYRQNYCGCLYSKSDNEEE